MLQGHGDVGSDKASGVSDEDGEAGVGEASDKDKEGWSLFGGLFRLPSHVWSVEGMTLLGSGSFWEVAFGTQHWATWSNGCQRIF